MTSEKDKAEQSNVGKVGVILFAISFGLYVLNVLVGKASVVYGWEIFHLGNVGEFLLLFTASIAFIVAALHSEAVLKNRKLKG
ncbi:MULTISPECIES: hypothetical protein [Desulfosediminicola]|uniref:hypothetical protein n=1 Tax=Desulfosediminicola TaxID=2886823 RepID=UPI0010AC38A0|nr:hypothetical protein [Desulfosediminicola ganghwensis]